MMRCGASITGSIACIESLAAGMVVWLLLTLFVPAIPSVARAGSITDALGFGGDDGALAKFDFRLRDDFYVTSVAWSPNGQFIATASTQSRLLHVWDVRKRSVVKEFMHGAINPYTHVLAWSPDGRYLAACSGAMLQVYRVNDWSGAHRFAGSESSGCITAVFSSDGGELAILGSQLRVFSTVDWHLLKESDLRNGWGRGHLTNAIRYVPRTHDILIGGGQFQKVNYAGRVQDSIAGYVWILRADETVPSRRFAVYPTSTEGGTNVISIDVSPDGRTVATGTATGRGDLSTGVVTMSVHIVSLEDGLLLGAPLDGMSFGAQRGLVYTPDGRYVIAGHAESQTRAIHLIDAQSERIVDVVHAGDAVMDIAAGPHGTRFAAAAGRQVLVWALPNRR